MGGRGGVQGTPCVAGAEGPRHRATPSAFARAVPQRSVVGRLLTKVNQQPLVLLIPLAWQNPQWWMLNESQVWDCFGVYMLRACSQLLRLLTRGLTACPFHCLMQLWKTEAFPPEDCGFLSSKNTHLNTHHLCRYCCCPSRPF